MTMQNNTRNGLRTFLALATGAGLTWGAMSLSKSGSKSAEEGHNNPIRLSYRDLAREPIPGSAPQRALYDFGSDFLIVLSDIERNGNYDHLEIKSCKPYRGHDLGIIYMSREISPNAREDERFRLVNQSFFDTFNQLLPEEEEK